MARFDIVGVDPRGVGASTPISCAPPGPQPGFFAMLSVACQEYPAEVRTFADMRRRIEMGRHLAPHLRGGSQSWLATRCIGWPVPAANPPRSLEVRGAAPVLIVNATHDANTGYRGAHVLAGQIPGSVVFTRMGDGHTSYLTSPCARAVIDRYLVDRAIEGGDRSCSD